MSGNLDVGTLSGRIEFEDKTSSTLDLVIGKLSALESRFEGAHHRVLETAEGFALGEVALEGLKEAAHLAAETLAEITIEGGHVAHVEETFQHLTERAGVLGDTLLGTLREGTRGTVTDLDLMTRVNQNLSVGLNLTTEQTGLLAKGAYALAKVTGGDASAALDTLSTAMVTGRTRAVALLTGKIDLNAAEEAFAKKLGTSAEMLTESGKRAAIQEVILKKVGETTERLGEQHVFLDDKIKQSQTTWANFLEEIGKTTATSPAVVGAFDEIRDAVFGTFGEDKEKAIANISAAVDGLAHVAVTSTHLIIDTGTAVVHFFIDYRTEVEAVAVVLGSYYAASKLAAYGTELIGMAALTAGGEVTTLGLAVGAIQALDFTSLGAAKVSISLLGEAAITAIGPIGIVAAGIGAMFLAWKGASADNGWIREISDGFEYAALRVKGYSAAEADAMIATEHLNQVSDVDIANKARQADAATKATEATKKQNDALEDLQITGKGYKTVLDSLDGAVVESVRYYLDAGVAQDKLQTAYGLTSLQIKALVAAKKEDDAESEKANYLLGQSKDDAKKYAEALKEMAVAGAGWKGVLEGIDGETVAAVKYYLDAGVAQDKLAAAYALTANQVKAIDDARKAELAGLKAEEDAANAIGKLYIDYYSKKADLVATDTQKIVVAAEKDYELHVADLQAKNISNIEYYKELWDLRNKDIDLGNEARLLADSNSRSSLLKRIDDAKDYLDFMRQNYGDYTDADRAAQEKVVANLKNTRDHWGQLGSSIKDVSGDVELLDHNWVTDADIAAAAINRTTVMVKTLSGELVSLAEAQKRQQTGGSFNVTSQNFAQAIENLRTSGGLNPVGQGFDVGSATTLARQGFSFAEIVQIFNNARNGATGPLPNPQGPRIPGFREGGTGDFGDGTLAILHGKEAIVPLDKVNTGGSVSITQYINGTAAEVARKVSDEIMRTLKQQRQFGAA